MQMSRMGVSSTQADTNEDFGYSNPTHLVPSFIFNLSGVGLSKSANEL